MDFTKKVNDFGSVDIMESATKKEVLMIATSRGDQVKDGKLTAFEGAGMGASITLVTLKDIKLFTEAVIKTAEDGNMKDYVTGNNIPQEIWDYKLTNGK